MTAPASISTRRHVLFAHQRRLIERRQARGILDVQIGAELDQRGERLRAAS